MIGRTDVLLYASIALLTAVAALLVGLDAPTFIRVPVLLAFGLIGPGFALARALPGLSPYEQIGVASIVSAAILVVISVLLLAVNRWSGAVVLVVLGVLAIIPSIAGAAALHREGEEA